MKTLKIGSVVKVEKREDHKSSTLSYENGFRYGFNSCKAQYDSVELELDVTKMNEVIFQAWTEGYIRCGKHKIKCNVNGTLLAEFLASSIQRVLRVKEKV